MVRDALFSCACGSSSTAAKLIYVVTAAPALDLKNVPLDKARTHLAKWLNLERKDTTCTLRNSQLVTPVAQSNTHRPPRRPTIADRGYPASVPDSSHAPKERSTKQHALLYNLPSIDKQKAHILAQNVQRLVADTSEADRLALLLAVDAITIVAAILSEELQRQCNLTSRIYPVARVVFSDAMLIPVFLLDLAFQSILGGLAETGISKNIDLPVQSLEDKIHWYCDRANPFTDYEVKKSPSLQEQDKRKPLLSFLYDHVRDLLTPLFEKTQPHLVPSDGISLLMHNLTVINAKDTDPPPPRASGLARCGVRFEVSDPAKPYVCFDNQNCVLFLPKIHVTDTTVRVIHNLLAYEATARLPAFVDSYVHLMDCLIDTADDVHILTEAGVICNKLGSDEELAAIWNKLCHTVCVTTSSWPS
ncbi:hypothetical protein L7F22_007324 [Adiantum nelumboides]|nr:hypothetical protein [Adiantum nelumboides]